MLLAGAKWSYFHRWLAHIPEADVPGHGRVESYTKIAQLKPPTSRKVLAETSMIVVVVCRLWWQRQNNSMKNGPKDMHIS